MAAPLWLALGRAPARFYRAAPLRRRPGPALRGDPADPRVAARRFGRLGEASAVAAWRLWPDRERLRELEAEEREWDPPLRDVLAALERREREEAQQREERQQRVAALLAEMPARVAAWREQRAQARERARQDAERRRRLLAEAGLGGPGRGAVPPPRAQAMLEELERQQRREEKRRRRQEREEAARAAMAAAEAAAAARPPPGSESAPSP